MANAISLQEYPGYDTSGMRRMHTLGAWTLYLLAWTNCWDAFVEIARLHVLYTHVTLHLIACRLTILLADLNSFGKSNDLCILIRCTFTHPP